MNLISRHSFKTTSAITFTFQTGNSKKLKGQVIRLQANWGPHIQEVKTNACCHSTYDKKQDEGSN